MANDESGVVSSGNVTVVKEDNPNSRKVSPSGNQVYNAAHEYADTDESTNSIHHTLGKGATQAANGKETNDRLTDNEGILEDHETRIDELEEDTGWLFFTDEGWFAAGFKDFSATSKCQLRRVGKQVFIRGQVAPNAGSFPAAVDSVAFIPTEYAPTDNPHIIMGRATTTTDQSTVTILGSSSGINTGRIDIRPSAISAWVAIDANWLIG